MRLTPTAIALALGAWCAGTLAQGITGQPTVRHGQASFVQRGDTLRVVNRPNTIIDWNSFGIAAGQTLRFDQESAASRVLNRVTGGTRSDILGSLLSNGQVLLVNPNGIAIGPQGRVDAAGFIASTLALSDADFLAGRLRFGDAGLAARGGIDNAGVILGQGGLVALVGAQVAQSGRIDAPGGRIALAAGRSVEIFDAHSPSIRVVLDAGGGRDADGRVHTLLQTGRLSAAALPAVEAEAAGLRIEGGQVVLQAQTVETGAGSVIDVSSPGARAGSVLALAHGDGRYAGQIVARGADGQGGWVETSAHRRLDVAGLQLDAPGGHWLLDPFNIEVVAGAGLTANDGAPGFGPSADSSQIGADLIQAQLNAGTSVTLNTAGAGSQAGNIVVNAPIVKTSNNAASLTLIAHNDITVNQNITLSNNELVNGTTSGVNAGFSATAGGVFGIHGATVEAWNIQVNAASIVRSGAQANDFVFGFIFPSAGTLGLTTQSGAVGSLAEPVRFASPDHAGRTWSVNTVAAGAAGDIFLQPTRASYGTFGGTAIQTDPATSQTVYLNHSGANEGFSLMGDISGNDHWTFITAGNLGTCSFGGCSSGGFMLTANSITVTAAGAISTAGSFATNATFNTSAVNGPIVLTAGAFDGTGCGGINFGVGVRPGTGTVSATSTGIPSCGGAIQLAHWGGDLLTSRYQLDFSGVNTGADNLIRLKAMDGHLILDSTAGMGASTQDKNWELSTVAANRDIVFSGGTIAGNRVNLRATRDIDNLAAGTTGWREVCVTGSCSWVMEAGRGIGPTNPIQAEADWVGTLQTAGSGAAGDLRVRFVQDPLNATPRIARLATDPASAQQIRIDGTQVELDVGQPGWGGADFITDNDALSMNLSARLYFGNWATTQTFASASIVAAGGVARDPGGGSNFLFSTTGPLSITTGGSIGAPGLEPIIPSFGSLAISAAGNVHLHLGANDIDDGILAGISTGAGVQTIALLKDSGRSMTFNGTRTLGDALSLSVSGGGQIVFGPNARYTVDSLTLRGDAQLQAGSQLTLAQGGSFGPVVHAGSIAVQGGTLDLAAVCCGPTFTDNGGSITMAAGATVIGPSGGLTLSSGRIGGSGTWIGAVSNSGGTVAPGASPGRLTIDGDYLQGAGGSLQIELEGTTAASQHDQLAVLGQATLGGTLSVTTPGTFIPATSDVFDIVTASGGRGGSFATAQLPVGYVGAPVYTANAVQLGFSTVPAAPVVVPPAATTSAPATLVNDLLAASERLRPLPISALLPRPVSDADEDTDDASILICR